MPAWDEVEDEESGEGLLFDQSSEESVESEDEWLPPAAPAPAAAARGRGRGARGRAPAAAGNGRGRGRGRAAAPSAAPAAAPAPAPAPAASKYTYEDSGKTASQRVKTPCKRARGRPCRQAWCRQSRGPHGDRSELGGRASGLLLALPSMAVSIDSPSLHAAHSTLHYISGPAWCGCPRGLWPEGSGGSIPPWAPTLGCRDPLPNPHPHPHLIAVAETSPSPSP